MSEASAGKPRRRVAVLQSSYVPWKGYFDIIHDVDVFVFYDDVQFTKNDWRNRNRIKTAGGADWLSIPVGKEIHRRIDEVPLPTDRRWIRQHLNTLQACYARAPHYRAYAPWLAEVLQQPQTTLLYELNRALTIGIAREHLGITTQFADSRDYPAHGSNEDRLLDLLLQVGATEYVSGPAARTYLDEARFAAAGVHVIWKDYAGYPEYAQVHPPYDPFVSILDLLFHVGADAPWHIWGWREAPRAALDSAASARP